MRVIGMDIHRTFAEAVALLDGKTTRLGRVEMRRDRLEEFARAALTHDDHVVVEATGNAAALTELLAPHVGRVVVANPKQVRLIAHAKVKTDAIDAAVLAKLYASGFLPEVWVPDGRTGALRRQVSRRTQLVRQRTRLKNIVHSILHAHLVPPCPHVDILSGKGRAWLAAQRLPEDERAAIERHMRVLDRLAEDFRTVERDIAQRALGDDRVKRLMTIPGVDLLVAVGLATAIGDAARFADPQRLVAYLGLNPSVRQSRDGPAHHGCIAKQGRGHARGMLVEAAWAAARSPGPLFLRISARRGQNVAVVATARKLAVLVWHLLRKDEDYAWVRPGLHAKKLRSLELRAGLPSRRGRRGAASGYNLMSPDAGHFDQRGGGCAVAAGLHGSARTRGVVRALPWSRLAIARPPAHGRTHYQTPGLHTLTGAGRRQRPRASAAFDQPGERLNRVSTWGRDSAAAPGWVEGTTGCIRRSSDPDPSGFRVTAPGGTMMV